jgi:cytidylate kinase
MNDKSQSRPYVITIGRTFGSGGRALGRLLADKLGIDYYDKELLVEAAKKAGLSREYFERNDERTPSFISGLIPFSLGFNPMAWYNDPSSISSDSIYKAQSDLIHELAERGSCVIVGRSADYVLRDVDNVVNIFVHAPIEHCVDRIVGRNECKTRAEAQALAEKTNKLRSSYYNFYTDKRWGDARSYDLTFDSSLLKLEDIAEIIKQYINCRFA